MSKNNKWKEQTIKNLNLFSSAWIGEYWTNNMSIKNKNKEIKIKTVVANELLEDRAKIFANNFIDSNMIQGDITRTEVLERVYKACIEQEPLTATITPPCQGSSGLNAYQNNPNDIRNQLGKSFFQLLTKKENWSLKDTLEYGFIENVTNYFSEKNTIPCKKHTIVKKGDWKEIKSELIDNYYHTHTVNKDDKTEQYKHINYQYFIIFWKDIKNKIKTNFKKQDIYNLYINWKEINNKYYIGFNKLEELEIKVDTLQDLKNYLADFLNKNQSIIKIISPISIIYYIQKRLKENGYLSYYKKIRWEEYWWPQIRKRWFLLFYKEELRFKKIHSLYRVFKWKNKKHYKGKWFIDAVKALDLIEEQKYSKDRIEKLKKEWKDYKILKDKEWNKKIYIDNAITYKRFKKEYKKWRENDFSDDTPNIHFYKPLKKRYKKWIEDTDIDDSAYFNKNMFARPYKMSKFYQDNKKLIKKREWKLYITKDKWYKAFYVSKQGEPFILNYQDFVSLKIRNNEKDWDTKSKHWVYEPFSESHNDPRNYMIYNRKQRKKVADDIDSFLKQVIIEKRSFKNINFEQQFTTKEESKLKYIYNILKSKINKTNINESNKEEPICYVFFWIKGFEKATYKRNRFWWPVNALTTKMGYWNSNAGHPIFDRLLTPAEALALFGVGYIIDENWNYKKASKFKLPTGIKRYARFKNLLYEITGEAVISLVSQEIMRQMTKMYLL